jgi:hypothetical protein
VNVLGRCPLQDGLDILRGDHVHEDGLELGLLNGLAIGGLFVFVHGGPHDLPHAKVGVGWIKRPHQFLDVFHQDLPGQVAAHLRTLLLEESGCLLFLVLPFRIATP